MPMLFPFLVDGRGCTAAAARDDDEYIRDLIEQILLTTPGERVNRPDFGSGLLGMVFAPGGDILAAALQANVKASLQRFMADLIQVQSVNIVIDESTLSVTVQYMVQRTRQTQVATITAPQLTSALSAMAGSGG